MLAVADVAGFLSALGITAPVLSLEDVVAQKPAMQHVIAVPTGGPRMLLERLIDVPTFQLRSVGLQRDYASAETLAGQVDSALLAVRPPATIAGRPLTVVDRVGGPPSFFARDSAGRTVFVCNYLFEVAAT